jgi:hypothetical protein
LTQPVVDSLRDVWEGYFGVPTPPGDTNWNAYTHQQLYDMVWQHAEPADVGSVADQWDRHAAELSSQTDALRNGQTALGSMWDGAAADSATAALGRLGDQTAAIGTRATTVGQATRQAGDALTLARNTMPKPLGDPLSTVISGAVAGAGIGAAIGGVVGGAFTGGAGTAPGAVMGAAVGAVAGGAASLFLGNSAAAQRKAEAVRVMQSYESNLRDSAHAVPGTVADTSRIGSAGDIGTTTTTSAFVGGGGGLDGLGGLGGNGAGVPWQQLVGANLGGANTGAAPGPGAMSGALNDAALARAGLLAADEASLRMTNPEGMVPPFAGRWGRGREDEEHKDRMPHPVQDHFSIEGGSVVPVIGGTDN